MSNKFDEMRAAVEEARTTLRAADKMAGSMASLLVGRLRHCDTWELRQLKRELRDFNMNTGSWRDRQ